MAKENLPTVHFVYIVPEGHGIRKWYNRAALTTGLFQPSYRSGQNRFIDWPEPIYAPFSITKNLTDALHKRFNVQLYDWFETRPCKIKENDILLFHPKPDYSTPPQGEVLWQGFDRNAVGWKTLSKFPGIKSFVIIPYTHQDHNGWLDEILELSQGRLIAICGEYWTNDWSSSPYKSRVKQLLQVNMCIDTDLYPFIKHSFNPPEKRGFLYIGHTGAYKNTAQLEKIAEALPNYNFGHIGYGEVRGWRKIAERMDFTPLRMSEIAREFDIFVNCSSGDAQATTILEQMCFGMAVACTPQSGYTYPSITMLDVNDTSYNCEQLRDLQHADADKLLDMSRHNRAFAEKNHSWSEFSSKILQFITE